MKKNTNNNIRLGIFVAIGIVLFIVGVYFIGKKQQLFSTTFRISGVFKDVSGLQPGNNVRFSGIDVGIVENITIISDTSVKVDLLINENTRKFIKKDAKAVIGSEGLMGNKIVTITPGTAAKATVQNNDVIGTTNPINFDEVFTKLMDITDNAAYITGDLADITGSIRSGRGTIGKLFKDTAFAENLDQTLGNIKQGTRGFQQNMEAAKHNILLRGFFKKKEKERDKKKEQKEKAKENK
jgi:phospholipid/cholesterol/gamma-HCH transport system substrate-binding protein